MAYWIYEMKNDSRSWKAIHTIQKPEKIQDLNGTDLNSWPRDAGAML